MAHFYAKNGDSQGMKNWKNRPAYTFNIAVAMGFSASMVEAAVVGMFYNDLPFPDQGRFLLFYAAVCGIVYVLLPGIAGTVAASIWKESRTALSAGIGTGWFIILFFRFYQVSLLCSWTEEPALSVKITAAGAVFLSVIFTAAAYFLSRTRIVNSRYAIPLFSVVAFSGPALYAVRLNAASAARPDALVSSTIQETENTFKNHDYNMILITVDTLRADHTVPYGYVRETSPNMQRLAERGILFERCIAQRSNTSPSVATLLTGKYPPGHQVFNNGDRLQHFNETLAEKLSTEGYYTAAVVANTVIGPNFNFHQGFDYFKMAGNRIPEDEVEESRLVNREVFKLLKKIKDRRFFLWIHYMDPHTPYIVPPEYKSLYTSDPYSDIHGSRKIPIGSDPQGSIIKTALIDDSQDIDYYVAQYDAEIKHVDDSLGDLFTALNEHRLWVNSVVVFTSDHGESMGEHEYYFAHGDHCYEPTVRVPLIWVHPEAPGEQRIDRPVSLVDAVPTICDILNIKQSSELQGQSFAPFLSGNGEYEMRSCHYSIGSYRNGYQTHSVTNSQYKLVHDVDERWILFDAAVENLATFWTSDDFINKYRCRVIKRELYDLAKDPEEKVNLIYREKSAAEKLDRKLREWQKKVYRTAANRKVEEGILTPQINKQLEALGYVN